MEPLYLSLERTFKIYSDERRPCSLQIVMIMVDFSRERNFSSVILFLFFQFLFFLVFFLLVNLGHFLFILVGKNLLFDVICSCGLNRLKNGHRKSIVRISISFIANLSSPGSTRGNSVQFHKFLV